MENFVVTVCAIDSWNKMQHQMGEYKGIFHKRKGIPLVLALLCGNFSLII